MLWALKFHLYHFCYSLTNRLHIEVVEQEEGGEASARHVNKKVAQPATKPDISEPGTAGEDPDRTESEDSDDSI